jgi:hypothetical protein
MQEQWEQECAALRADVAALQQQVQALATQKAGAQTLGRWCISKSMRLVLLPVLVLLAGGGLLYGEGAIDALFIDKDGNVGIGTTEPHATLDVKGVVKARTVKADTMLGATKGTKTEKMEKIEDKNDYVMRMTPEVRESDGFVVGRLNVVNRGGDARCWIAGLIEEDEKGLAVEAKSWLEVKSKELETSTSFTMPLRKADKFAVLYGCIKGEKQVHSIEATIYWIPLGG